MKQLLRKLIRGLAYLSAAVVILLAIAVGIFRLMLPRLPEYQEEIKDWASTAIGMDVEFSAMTARWRLSGPELSFFEASLNRQDSGEGILMAQEVSVGVGLLRLISDRELVVDRVSIQDSFIDVRQNEDGAWLLQGIPIEDLVGSREISTREAGDVEVVVRNIDVDYEHPASGQVVPLSIESLVVSRSQTELALEADIDLPETFGDRLEISANQLQLGADEDVWRLYIEGDSLDASGWARLQPVGFPNINSGIVDASVWIDVANNTVQSATANVTVTNLQAASSAIVAPFGFRGSFEYSQELDGWLLGANQLRVSTVDGEWPESELQLRVINDIDGNMSGLRAETRYFNLNDLKYVSAWFPDAQMALLDDFAPTGIVHTSNVDISSMQSDDPQFDISADLTSAGFAGVGERPGVREFSGRVRADRDGGRVEIESTDLRLDMGPKL